MTFKHRIWLLPIMTAVIVTIGIAVNSRITAATSAALTRVEFVQYPTVEALSLMRREVVEIQDLLQRAVAASDKRVFERTELHAGRVRNAIQDLVSVSKNSSIEQELRLTFDRYYVADLAATRILLGIKTGDAAASITQSRVHAATLMQLLTKAQEEAIGEFRALLSQGNENLHRSLIVSLAMAAIMIGVLGLCSWIVIGRVFRSLGGEPEMAAATVRSIAAGDLTTSVRLRSGDASSLLHGIDALRTRLGSLICDIRRTSNAVGDAAADINAGIDRLSERTSEQAGSLEQTALSMEQMTLSVKRNADHARHANQLATAARDQAERGGTVAARAVTAMAEISSSSKRIADIIGVIDEIAFQTNLLALNAAVEAARAGEQGRGFAVVASEVRSLAQRSANAAREIKGLINDSLEKVHDGSRLVDESGKHLNDIVGGAKKVADIIGEISEASQQQADGLSQVNIAICQMDSSTRQNAAMAKDASSIAASMQAQAQLLTEMIAVFNVGNEAAHVATASAPTAQPLRSSPASNEARVTTTIRKKVAGSDLGWQEF